MFTDNRGLAERSQPSISLPCPLCEQTSALRGLCVRQASRGCRTSLLHRGGKHWQRWSVLQCSVVVLGWTAPQQLSGVAEMLLDQFVARLEGHGFFISQHCILESSLRDLGLS
jgi:hypothetical protein